MLFNSYIFIFVFLPSVLMLYYACNRQGRYSRADWVIILASYLFYGYTNPWYVILLVFSTSFNYMIYVLMSRKMNKWICISGIVFNLLVLGYFKYYNFFLDNLNHWLGSDFTLKRIVLPLGISFFTFQQISFMVDAYKGECKEIRLREYLLFVSFFPQLVAGPIVNHQEMIPQFRDSSRRQFDSCYFAKGIAYFVIGLAKKVLLADLLAKPVEVFFQYDAVLKPDSWNVLLVAICYSMQLFLDFSGYCDMAKGIGYLFHIEIMDNFDKPFWAVGVRDYWKRWHISLGRFFTKYVFIPLGGSRKGKFKTCRNAFIVFALSGLWHGAEWTFVLWGILHGIGYIYDYLLEPVLVKVPIFIRRFATFLFVSLAFLGFRSENLSQMMRLYKSFFSGGISQPLVELTSCFQSGVVHRAFKVFGVGATQADGLVFYGIIGVILGYLFFGKSTKEIITGIRYKYVSALSLALVFILCVLKLSRVSVFLYFNF